ncbi:hypothetical protein ACFY93_06415 [Streptomyces sp. NPDC008313]|uniref:hypothetical protein n=1 Tax=Streptomyces sp. NPDC008313 TaxID=3364826 RepID=UPI0036E8B964
MGRTQSRVSPSASPSAFVSASSVHSRRQGESMKWFKQDRSGREQTERGRADRQGDGSARELSGVVKTGDAPPEAAPALLTAGGRTLQRADGDSSQVVRLTTGTGPVILDITHRAGGRFVVDALDQRLHSESQLVYTDGPFACRALVNADDRPVRALRIQADGPWTVEATEVSSAVTLDGHAHRDASDVLRYEGGPAIANLRYEGDARSDDGGYFLVDTFEPTGDGFVDELANHVGRWQGEAPLTGPCLIYARSDGPWSIGVEELAP